LQEQHQVTESIDELLKNGASESEIFEKIEEYKEKFADYGRDRRSAIEFHVRNIERLLKPTQTTSVVLATLQGGPPSSTETNPTAPTTTSTVRAAGAATNRHTTTPSTATENLDSKTLFKQLVKILEVTPEQAAALKDSRSVALEMDDCLRKSLSVLQELRTRLTQCGEDLEAEFNNVRAILTPTQAAKFLVWVANNKACIHMLNELWNKVYPGGDEDSP
jgi:hypothetical protein